MGHEGQPREQVAVIGAGRVGTAMASVMSSRGYRVAAVADVSSPARRRAAELSGAEETPDPIYAARAADVVLITTSDGVIEKTAALIAASGIDVTGKKFIHMSGALSLWALEPLKRRGAHVLSIHPLQTFADLEGALSALPGSSFGVTCDADLEEWAGGFVSDLDGTMQMINDRDKVIYHAAAVLASNLLVMVEYGARSIARELGMDDDSFSRAFMPLSIATIDNVKRVGPIRALTGPLCRGDLGTIEAHLEALERLDPALVELYRSVCLWGLRLVEERGDIDAETVEAMRDMLVRRDLNPQG